MWYCRVQGLWWRSLGSSIHRDKYGTERSGREETERERESERESRESRREGGEEGGRV
jgi:hypothetical protein